ncbi:hypothetical protein JTE90_019529 [Oedothorax gibbosus]|uniref:Uncharacterized protein n=1 Tax=Oedothorax gibbosus TaxID=931172 RepID=A0AAV6VIQ3_9ARAC|nr:hypothetical protein JTE90_019529 [Oedothorax gibbosus]
MRLETPQTPRSQRPLPTAAADVIRSLCSQQRPKSLASENPSISHLSPLPHLLFSLQKDSLKFLMMGGRAS